MINWHSAKEALRRSSALKRVNSDRYLAVITNPLQGVSENIA
ncbi:hypothetical protein [Nodularia sp. UHCC 0506]|nr:hypothetical protein [Nodularia sp. UHCC 0506]MEA5513035.1 hypothetical protein [Nodularia sp. UHCC 0506]